MPPQAGTAPYTKFIASDEFKTRFQKASLSILDACKPDGIFLDESGRPIDVCSGIFLINHLAIFHKWDDIIRKTFVQCFMAAEQGVTASGIFACYALAKLAINDVEFDLTQVSKQSHYTTVPSVHYLIKELLDDTSGNLLSSVLHNTGTCGQLNIQTGSKTKITLEVFSGHNFHIGVDPSFCVQSVNRDSALVFLIDGVVESVGEIDHFLRYCHENKCTALIIARRFGDDVISTLNMNFQRKTLDVIPLKVKDEISHLNIFSDLAITTGSNVINDSSGQTIVGFDPRGMVVINGLRCSNKNFSFNSKTDATKSVKNRIKKLKKRIYAEMIQGTMNKEDIDIFLRERINSLSTNSVTLWLPIGSNKTGLYEFISSRFNFGIGVIDGMCKTGIIDIENSVVNNIFYDLKIAFLPANILIHSLFIARNIMTSIKTAGGCIVIEQVGKCAHKHA